MRMGGLSSSWRERWGKGCVCTEERMLIRNQYDHASTLNTSTSQLLVYSSSLLCIFMSVKTPIMKLSLIHFHFDLKENQHNLNISRLHQGNT